MIHIGGRELGERGGDSPGEEERQVILFWFYGRGQHHMVGS